MLFTTAAGFFVPVPSTGWIGFAFKGTLFAIDLFLIAMVLYPPRPKKSHVDAQEGKGDLPTSDLELDGSEIRDGAWEGYGKAFRWLSNEYVSVIRKTFSASCAAFYLKNNRGELRIHAADGGEVDPDTLDDDDNLVNHVFLQKVPHLAEALPSGSTLPGIPDVDIRSFLGVPLQWGNKTIGVMALGSDTEDDFSEEDRGILAHYGSLLTGIMAAFHRGLILETDYEVIKTQLDLECGLKTAEDEDEVFRIFVENMHKLFPFDRFTVCLADANEGLIRHVQGQMDQQRPGMRFSLDEGLAGWIIKRKVPLILPDLQQGEYCRPRYSRNEPVGHGLHSFLGVPLGRDDHFKGCLTMESRNRGQYNDKIKDVFNRLSEQLDYALDRIVWMRRIRTPSPQRGKPGATQFEME